MAFYDLMFNQCKPAEAMERYAGDEVHAAQPARRRRQAGVHRLFRADGPRVSRQAGGIQARVAEGDYVVLHCHQQWPGDRTDWAGIDIFRLDANGKVVEHWDVLQVVPRAVGQRQLDVLATGEGSP